MKNPPLPKLLLAAALVASFPLLGAQAADESPAPSPPATTVPSDANFRAHVDYQTSWEDYLATQKGKPCDIVFIGDSITQQWRWGYGKPVWEKHFANRALDFGEGSDSTQHTLWRLKNLPVKEFKPKVAVILIGTNNVNNSPEEIATGVEAVVKETKSVFPGAKIILMSILPNARATQKMADANVIIKTMADEKEIFYLDLAAKMTPEGENWKGLQRDRLHLTTAGYEMWAAELEPLLARLAPKQG
ncbi:MAG: platelet-activating factor acetylhydrolase subunit beta/gamma [Chthoniobacter sp.]|jgi:lysophospholipase L1-like esterase|nr:platelet-activating factor acetylhydrolase subunit beta/gamma [Chthoniobacter sp.]